MPIVIPIVPPAPPPPPAPPVLATSAPEISLTGEFLYDEVSVAQPGDETRGWPARILVGAVAKCLGPLFDLVRDQDDRPGWSDTLDPDRAPAWALSWLGGNFAGVTFPEGMSEADQRLRITSPPAFDRGTPNGMKAAIKTTLTGTDPYVFFQERQGSPYRVTAITRASETPDTAATLRAALSQKPAGLILTHIATNVRTILQVKTDYPTIGAVKASFATIADVRGF